MVEFLQSFKQHVVVGLDIVIVIGAVVMLLFFVICAIAGIVHVVNFYRGKIKEKI